MRYFSAMVRAAGVGANLVMATIMGSIATTGGPDGVIIAFIGYPATALSLFLAYRNAITQVRVEGDAVIVVNVWRTHRISFSAISEFRVVVDRHGDGVLATVHIGLVDGTSIACNAIRSLRTKTQGKTFAEKVVEDLNSLLAQRGGSQRLTEHTSFESDSRRWFVFDKRGGRFREKKLAFALSGLMALIALTSIVSAVIDWGKRPEVVLLYVLVAATSIALAVRSLRMEVHIVESGLQVRNLLWTHRVPFNEIKSFSVHSGVSALQLITVRADLISGSSIRLDAIREQSIKPPLETFPGRVAIALNEQLRARSE